MPHLEITFKTLAPGATEYQPSLLRLPKMPDETLAASKPQTIQQLVKPTITYTQKGSNHMSNATVPVLSRIVFPCRYAVICSEDEAMLQKLAPNKIPSGNLGKDLLPLEDEKTTRYGIRQMREGYIYVYVERTKPKKQCKCEVAVRVKPNGDLESLDGFPSNPFQSYKCFQIEDVVPHSVVRMLYTPDPLTKRMMEAIRTDAQLRDKIQKIDLQRNDLTDQIEVDEIGKYVAEDLTGQDTDAWNLLADSPAGCKPLSIPEYEIVKSLIKTDLSARHVQGFAVVLDDPIGITQELNAWRNAGIEDTLNDWLSKTTTLYGKQVSNDRRFNVAKSYFDLKSSYPGRAAARELIYQKNNAWFDITQDQDLDDDTEWEEQAAVINKDMDEWEKTKKRLDAQAKKNKAKNEAYFREEFQRKYVAGGYVNEAEMNKAISEHQAQCVIAENKFKQRVSNHQKWLLSENLLKAFDFYDDGNPADPTKSDRIENGLRFAGQSGLCVYGAEACPSIASKMDEWWAGDPCSRSNLAFRGLCLNQKAFENETKVLMAQGRTPDDIKAELAKSLNPDKLAKKAEELASAQDTAEQNDASSTAATLIVGGFTGLQKLTNLFDAANKVGEILPPNEADKILGSGFIWFKNFVEQVLKSSFMNAAVGKLVPRCYRNLMIAACGSMAVQIRVDELKALGQQVSETRRNRIAGQIKKRMMGSQSALGNALADSSSPKFFKIRGGTLLLALEAIMLGINLGQGTDQDENGWWDASYLATLFTTSAAGVELSGRIAELMVDHVSATSKATMMGAKAFKSTWKLAGGTLAATGSLMLAVSDGFNVVQSIEDHNHPLILAYSLRTLSYAGLFVGQTTLALGEAAPFAQWLMGRVGSNMATEGFLSAANWAADLTGTAAVAAGRQVAARVLACLVPGGIWISIGLTVIIWLLEDSQMESWCKQTIYRGAKFTSDKKTYDDEQTELVELDKALGDPAT
jgi:hypothetical protein